MSFIMIIVNVLILFLDNNQMRVKLSVTYAGDVCSILSFDPVDQNSFAAPPKCFCSLAQVSE